MTTEDSAKHYRYQVRGWDVNRQKVWRMGAVSVRQPEHAGGKAWCTVEPDASPTAPLLETLSRRGHLPKPFALPWADDKRDGVVRQLLTIDQDQLGNLATTDPLDQFSILAMEAVRQTESAYLMSSPTGRASVGVHPQEDGLSPGEYFGQVWRPCSLFFEAADGLESARADAHVTGRRLDELLAEIFAVIHPVDTANHAAYGHRTRELLILACTEVENSWKAVFDANHYVPVASNGTPVKRATTTQYVELMVPLRLGEWSVGLVSYPSTTAIRPFDGWSKPDTSATIPWYDAYNKTKHGRAKHFGLATLWTAVTAVAAAWVMYGAQFGPAWVDRESRLFRVKKHAFDEDTRGGYVAPQSPLVPAEFKAKNLPL